MHRAVIVAAGLRPLLRQRINAEDGRHRAHLPGLLHCAGQVTVGKRLVARAHHIVDLGERARHRQVLVHGVGEGVGPLADLDAAARQEIVAAGYGEYFVHSTGHGIGLDVHEAPFASSRAEGVLATGMTLTIEPGIYVPGTGGARIEDTVVITDGDAEIITPLPKTL